MAEFLKAEELVAMVRRVFQPAKTEREVGILVDLPDADLPDHAEWRLRRERATHWFSELERLRDQSGLNPRLIAYRNVRQNNADLPEEAWLLRSGEIPGDADTMVLGDARNFEELLSEGDFFLAPTELSATAPLKLLAPRLGFRAATMPGFSEQMIPALRLDYGEVNRRVMLLKNLLDMATGAELVLTIDQELRHRLYLDLRHRRGHASGGMLTQKGMAGNLPSGEAYIVPYEGEIPGDPSRTRGIMPVEIEGEILLYEIENNRVRRIFGQGSVVDAERDLLRREPAYGNIAELGLGVLGAFGLDPIGEILLDEKLGLHIAFGRSDHFGGQIGAAQFSCPESVIHLDRVYVPKIQPRVIPEKLVLHMPDRPLLLMADGDYVIDFGAGIS